MSNPFYTPDDIDDDEFLNHPRSGSSGYMLPADGRVASSSSTQPVAGRPYQEATSTERLQQQLIERRREIEQRTLGSSERSIGLLYESEKAGLATAEELSRQKEQLKMTEQRLDDINDTLKKSERHLQGIKSLFGGIRNYFGSKPAVVVGGVKVPTDTGSMAATSRVDSSQSLEIRDDRSTRLDALRDAQHPALRTRGLVEHNNGFGAGIPSSTGNSVDELLDRNLDEMSSGLSRLKGLALNLNEELDDHNDILDRLDDKTARAHITTGKQTKDMNRILKK